MAASPLSSPGQKEGGSATQPLHSRRSPTPSAGRKSERAAFSGAQKRAQVLCNPCTRGSPTPSAGRKSEVASVSGAQKRAEVLRNPCILGGPQRQARGENQKWLPHPCLLGGPKEGGSATLALHSWRSPTPSAGRNSEVATSLLPSRGPKRGRKCYVTPAFLAVPNTKRGEKLISGCLTPAFSGAQKRVEVLRNPCILGGPQHQARGENQKGLPSRGPKRGWNCYATHAFLGIPNTKHGEKIRSGFRLEGPKEGGSAT